MKRVAARAGGAEKNLSHYSLSASFSVSLTHSRLTAFPMWPCLVCTLWWSSMFPLNYRTSKVEAHSVCMFLSHMIPLPYEVDTPCYSGQSLSMGQVSRQTHGALCFVSLAHHALVVLTIDGNRCLFDDGVRDLMEVTERNPAVVHLFLSVIFLLSVLFVLLWLALLFGDYRNLFRKFRKQIQCT